MTLARSSLSAVVSLVLAGLLSVFTLAVLYWVFQAKSPGSENTQEVAAWFVTVVAVAVAFTTLIGGTWLLANMLKANPWLGIVEAGLLAAFTGHFLLWYITLINGCGVGQNIPYNSMNFCG